MRSPSSLRLNLMVPWEAGCDGPIWISITSSVESPTSGFLLQRAGNAMGFSVRGRGEPPPPSARGPQRIQDRVGFGHHRLAPVDGIVFAQRMTLEGIVEQDAAEVGMALEADAEHVVTLALEPVGRLPQSGDAIHPQVGLARADLDAQGAAASQRAQMIYDLEAGCALHPVDRGQIGEKVEAEVRLVA